MRNEKKNSYFFLKNVKIKKKKKEKCKNPTKKNKNV